MVSLFETALYMNLIILCLSKWFTDRSGGNGSMVSYCLISVAFLQFFVLIFLRLISIAKHSCGEKLQQMRLKMATDEDAVLEEIQSDSDSAVSIEDTNT